MPLALLTVTTITSDKFLAASIVTTKEDAMKHAKSAARLIFAKGCTQICSGFIEMYPAQAIYKVAIHIKEDDNG